MRRAVVRRSAARELYRALGHATLELYATQALGFTREPLLAVQAPGRRPRPPARAARSRGDGDAGLDQGAAGGACRHARDAGAVGGQGRHDRSARTGPRSAGRARCGADRRATRGGPRSAANWLPAPTPIEASFTLRGDVLQVARLEALLEKARKQRRGPAGATRWTWCWRRWRRWWRTLPTMPATAPRPGAPACTWWCSSAPTAKPRRSPRRAASWHLRRRKSRR
jgi:hypothetical protein